MKTLLRFAEIDLTKPLLSDAEVEVVTGLSKSTQRRMALAGNFPEKVAVTDRIKGRATPAIIAFMEARGVAIAAK
jgi:predicted DNA-binding transcriptional regulator AlpA